MREVVPLATRYCDVPIPATRVGSRMERWQRIVREASKQCGRFSVPKIGSPLRFEEFVEEPAFKDAIRFLFHEKASNLWNLERLTSHRVVICIGPEGGWDPREIEASEEAGYQIFSLGPRVLRAETAAVTALAILQYRFGDLGPKSSANDE